MTPRLSDTTLPRAPEAVARPAYDRRSIRTGVVHLGLGAFHRAHQAVAFDDLLASGDDRWGVLGVSMRSSRVRDRLAPQDGLYVVSVQDGDTVSDRAIGAMTGLLAAHGNPEAVVRALAGPNVKMTTLTVTEKGYRLDPATGELNRSEDDVGADLAGLKAPRTVPGLIAAGLARRRTLGLDGLTIASCDNIPGNGRRLEAAVLEIARATDPGLADWIAEHAAFPNSMVDRIVPATGADDLDQFEARAGLRDEGLVRTEPFSQWVIENRFAPGAPDLSLVGVDVVADVAPWETAKLRLLNGAHSMIAYLAGLSGTTFVHDCVARPEGVRAVLALWDEVETTLHPAPDQDLRAYREALMLRFRNTALQHRTAQIAVDGSQKIPPRLLAPITDRLRQGLTVDAACLGVAAWIAWLTQAFRANPPAFVDDPLAGLIRDALAQADGPAARVLAMVAIDAIFPAPLATDPRFLSTLVSQLSALERDDSRRFCQPKH